MNRAGSAVVDNVESGQDVSAPRPAMSDADVLGLLRDWLLFLAREKIAGEVATRLLPQLSRWFGVIDAEGAAANRFLEALRRRILALDAFVEPLEGPAPPESTLGRWIRSAREILDAVGDPRADLKSASAALVRRRNVVWSAALNDAVGEAAGEGPRPEGWALLRKLDAEGFANAPLPPALGASWNPDDYLFARRDAEIVADLAGLLDAVREREAGDPAGRPTCRLATEGVASVAALLKKGWPIPVAKYEEALVAARNVLGNDPRVERTLSRPAHRADPRAAFGSKSGTAPTRAEADPFRNEMRRVVGRLRTSPDSDAAAMVRRIEELASVEEPARRRSLLFGVLNSLDQDAGTTGWRQSLALELLRVAKSLGQFEVIGEESLLNKPLGSVVSVVEVVHVEDGPATGSSPRIVRVVRPGVALLDSSQGLDSIVRARVSTTR